jgi:hypothetical protein
MAATQPMTRTGTKFDCCGTAAQPKAPKGKAIKIM